MTCADDWWDAQLPDYVADDPDDEPYRRTRDVIRDLADYHA